MKTVIIKIKLMVLLLCFTCVGCNKNNDSSTYFEISPDSEDKLIKTEENGIEFIFCLLNEQEKPSTTFNEGDNFSFVFSVTNHRNEDLYFDPNFAYSKDNGFCRVYNSVAQNIGKPWEFIGYNKVGYAAYPFNSNTTYTFQQLWVDQRDSIWRWENGFYKSTHQMVLSKGNYYTEFEYKFQFVNNKAETLSDFNKNLYLKINFKIQ